MVASRLDGLGKLRLTIDFLKARQVRQHLAITGVRLAIRTRLHHILTHWLLIRIAQLLQKRLTMAVRPDTLGIRKELVCKAMNTHLLQGV